MNIKNNEIEFIPCDNHPQIPATEMTVSESGVVGFSCYACGVAVGAQVTAGIDMV